MKTTRTAVSLGFAAVLCLSCGRKGSIFPPLVLVPQTIETLTPGQRGDQVVLEWPAPTVFINGNPLPPSVVTEIWMLSSPAAAVPVPTDPADFPKKARKVAVLDVFGRPVSIEAKPAPPAPPNTPIVKLHHWEWTLSPSERASVRLTFGLRTKAGRKDFSEFRFADWLPRPIPVPPANLKATVFRDRIEIRWAPPSVNMDGSKPPLLLGYHLYRTDPGGAPVLLGTTTAAETFFNDPSFEFGLIYAYRVRALTGEETALLESEDSAVLEVAPVDVFPPSPPTGLTSVTATGLITLFWEPSPEADVAGYRVWRRMAGEKVFRALNPAAIVENTFSDASVEKGRRYEYAVSAVDRRGNESPRTAAINESIKDPRI
jgi:hypothetical protein